MPCSGECKKQIYQFSARLTDVSKSHRHYPELSMEEKNAILESKLSHLFPVVLSKNCQAADCDCIRIAGQVEIWSLPVKYLLSDVIRVQNEECVYELFGIYEVKSSLYTGLSMPKATGNNIQSTHPVSVPVQNIPSLNILKKTLY